MAGRSAWIAFGIGCLLTAATLTEAQRQVRAPRPRRPSQGLRVPEGVEAHRDLEYAKAGEKKLLLDLYVPKKREGKLPVVVWVHGGGWQGGNKRACSALPLTARGYAAASINYRLSHEAVYPAQIHDCKAAIRWLRANAETYGLDPERIGVWGSSAGGHLVALLGATGDVKELEGDLGNPKFFSRVQAVVDVCGPTDLLKVARRRDGQGRVRRLRAWSPVSRLLGGPVQENPEKAAKASPVTYVSKDDAPFLIIHGQRDGLVPVEQAKLLHAALKKAGVDSTLTITPGGHGRHIAKLDEVARFFDRHLKDLPAPPAATQPAASTPPRRAGEKPQ